MSAGTTALLLATIPLWMILGRRIADHERIGGLAALGLAAGKGGVALLVHPFGGAPVARSPPSPI